MSDELIIELIAAIKAAIADGRGELTPKNLRRRLWAASIVAARGNDDNVGDECHSSFAISCGRSARRQGPEPRYELASLSREGWSFTAFRSAFRTGKELPLCHRKDPTKAQNQVKI